MEVKPSYKQTEAGVIPVDWHTQPLLSAVRVASGQVDPRVEPYRSMILVAPDHIAVGSGRLIKMETAGDQRAISGKYLFSNGDIVYSKIRPYLKKAVLANFAGLCSADMYPLRPAADVSPGFILAIILGHRFTIYAESVSVRSGMPKINRAELAEFTVALPPTKAEQEAIAGALSDADALIGSLEQLISKKRQVKQGSMQELLTGKRRLPGFSGEWEVKRLGDSATLKARIGWQGLTTAEYLDSGDCYLVTGTEFKNGFIDWNNCHYVEKSRYKQDKNIQLKQHDVLVTKDGTIGKVALVANLPSPATLNSGVFVIRPREGAFNPEFFYYLLCSNVFTKYLDQLSAGSTINHLYQKDFVGFTYMVPPSNEEQTAIAAILSDMDAELAALEDKLVKARQLKQGMMQVLLTGRIRLV
jgi:type I restriction enzyme S subunit